ncbi:MAG TPA: methyltransferase domain-containing protein [Burkholderiales bacterium]|jgi:SAM-dependent methyltransferase|nr:methyltransferase domain-containing protein [Burkholderiales bacterium]
MSSAMEQARELFTAGLARHVEKDHAGAEELYRQALALMPGRPSILFNLGRLLLDLGRLEEAEDLFRQVVEQAPDHESCFNLGLVLSGQGRFADSLAPYEQAIALKPDFAPAQAARAWTLEQLGRLQEALEGHARSAELAPDNSEYQLSFSRCAAQSGGEFDPRAAPVLETAALICLKGANIDYQQLQGLCLALLERRFKRFREQMEAADFDWAKVARTAPQELRAFCGDWLLLGSLEKIALSDFSNEAFFTGLRRGLLDLALADAREPALETLAAGVAVLLACQCFLNEYVWDQGEEETARLYRYLARVESGTAAGGNDLQLGVLGCYMPLHQHAGLARWGRDNLVQASPALRRLLQMQVAQPLAEAEIAQGLSELAPIKDRTSQAVKAQYEENPYPRWLSIPRATPLPYIEQILRDIAPYRPSLRAVTATPEILVAGSGTGRHALSYARAFSGARITAIDLSNASLAYAVRKAQELEVRNVRFLRGDILDLDALDRQFDVISSVGVLHHMADPEAGLQALLRRLRPDGYLLLGLYSELARRDIVSMRRQIEAQELPATPEGIRACRAWMRRQPGGEFTRLMQEASDFYSTSMVRDLLFHVQERRYTVPQLHDMLARHRLEFIGMATHQQPQIKALYRQSYPQDEEMLDLARWDALEMEHPHLFRGMYQFWVCPIPA